MKTSSNNDKIYLGRDIGNELLKEIKNAKKSVKIVSPYLSASYVKELIELNKKGKEVTLITCDKVIDERSRYANITTSDLVKEIRITVPENEKKRKRVLFAGLMIFLLSLIVFVTNLLIKNEVVLSISIVLFVASLFVLGYGYLFIETYKIEYKPIFRIKVFDSTAGEKPWSTELVHSKIYIIDEEKAYLGSMNFSYSGFKTHYESLIEINDIHAIRDISNEVERLYSSHDFRVKGVRDWV